VACGLWVLDVGLRGGLFLLDDGGVVRMTTLFRWPRIPAWLRSNGTRIETKYGVFEIRYQYCDRGCCQRKAWFHLLK
jgi:hypothetical protein